MTMLYTFRVMLYAGVGGSAYWSRLNLPIPYPLPFGSSLSTLFGWLAVTTFQSHLQADALLMGTLLDGCWIRFPSLPPFIPASGFDG
jgi:hypothetical protein